MNGPLSGIRIIEVCHMLAGPYCGMLLADLGADVVKVEGPSGDIARLIGPHKVGAHNTYFASLNRNKKSIVLDLTTEGGQAELRRLAQDAHALVTNLRPGAIKRLGLTYDTLRTTNENLTCVALTGYGLEGPFSDSPAYDYVIQALTGVTLLTGDPDGPPVKPGYSAVDNSAGIMGAVGLLAKLIEGKGGQVDVSMYDVMLSQLNYLASSYLNSGQEPDRTKDGGHPYIVPAQIFPARSGHVVLFITHDKFWRLFAEALGEPEWMTDERFSTMDSRARNRDVVVDAIKKRLLDADAETWVERLAPLGLVVAAVRSLSDALNSQLTRSRDMVVDIPIGGDMLRLVGNPIRFESARGNHDPPPLLGEHNGLYMRAGRKG